MSRLADFGRQGSGGSGESIKKIKSVTKIFRKMLNEVLKSCKIISADVKADVKQQEMQEIVAVFVFFIGAPSKLEIQYPFRYVFFI